MAVAMLSRVRFLYHHLWGLYATYDSAHARAAMHMRQAIAIGEPASFDIEGGLLVEAYLQLAVAYERLGEHDDAVATAATGRKQT